MTARTSVLAIVAGAVLAGLAAYAYFVLPRTGRVLDFKISSAAEDRTSKAAMVVAEVSVDGATPDDYAATAVAIASAVPAGKVIVSIERNDVPASAGSWRRTLARAEFGVKDAATWAVSTAEPPLAKNEISAAIEYSERVGLSLTDDGAAMPSEMDEALIKELAAKYSVDPLRVMTYTPLYREVGSRWGWKALEGSGSPHLTELAKCFAGSKVGSDAWSACR